jgi:hypothetical protein
MPADCPATALGVPDALVGFIREVCRTPVDALGLVPPDALPEPAHGLLVHRNDMTSTLASHHGSSLRVQVLQQRSEAGFHLREVFLRTADTDQIVEYGVIAINLDRFTAPQQAEIEAGKVPLGALLHEFGTPFVSSPRGFFSVAAPDLAATPLAAAGEGPGYGRFNRLTTETGEDIAWIMEILPPA